ncbi:hypothetical protein [Streptomyces hiroshimensis]|uniref:Hsp70 family protein n=1 Tax=Streptomyces hiroshimensis TaxID=66424 RepID=A0ABQ2Y7X8_9ACTN|nr:hypothetical protein [Streptomyces hiroshimensis]GGX73278.1 hypothetical protein GCM10010324_18140 [Streptomyces hiroshimensis]
MTTSTAIAVDVGARFTRIAHGAADGTPVLAELPGLLSEEGLPTPESPGPDGHNGPALRAAYAAYLEHYGTPEQVVLVVPQQDRAGHTRRATDVLTALHGSGPAPRLRTLGTPHAVMALLRHAGTATAPRYAVCDLGATAAEVSVCALTPGSVAVTGSARHAPSGGYGAGFDAALLAGAGLPDDAAGRRELAWARAREGVAQRIDTALERTARRPGRYESTVVHQVAGREITVGVVRRALGRLTDGLGRTLDEVRLGRPAPPVIAVGGAARFGPLVQYLTGLQGAPVALPGGTDPALAVVFGAALVAAGRVDPADRYPYAVSVGTHRTVAGELRAEDLLISPAGVLEPGGGTVFAEAGGQRVRIRTGSGGRSTARPVRIRVHDADGGSGTPVGVVSIPPGSEGERYHVGVRIAVDGTARLVLQPLGSGTPGEYPLGVLPADLEGAHS